MNIIALWLDIHTLHVIGRIQQLWSVVLVVGGPVAAWIDYCRPPYKVCSEEQL